MNKNSIQIVLVLYKTNLVDSLCYKSLIQNIDSFNIEYELIIYNNSEEITVLNKKDIFVVNSAKNEFLVGAYAYGLKRAMSESRKWLLLLDQDTIITKDFFEELNVVLSTNKDKYAAIVPILKQRNSHLSPVSYYPIKGPYWKCRSINSSNYEKIFLKGNECISAFNSAALINTKYINEIGGFSESYPLDMLDHWYFFQFFKSKKPVFVLKSTLEQRLSLLDKEGMSIDRYKIYLEAERKFAGEIGVITIISYKIRLTLHLISQLIRRHKRKYITYTIKNLFK